ncbi:MAG: MotA/TolQ/ExbB proton channel family protein, partial [Planctomycetota bacterium]
EWRGWIHRPSERTGMIGDFLHYVCGTGSGRSVKEVTHAFHGLRQSEILPFERDLKVMKVCVSAAPLVGLLGTVTGMLSTFGALSSGAGGDQTMSMIAEGISEALITTMTGLVISLPGLFFQYFLTRGFERYKVFLAHFESVCVQSLFTESEVEKRIAARRLAKARIAKALRKRLAERGVDPQLRRALHAGATSPELTPLQSVEA